MNALLTPLRLTRPFDAAADRVFDAWLDVQKVRQWFAPGLGPVVCVDIGSVVGGALEIVQRRGIDDVVLSGEVVELDRPHRLVFTWQPPRQRRARIAVDIVARGDGRCELTLTHDAHDGRDDTTADWGAMLDAMARTLAADRAS